MLAGTAEKVQGVEKLNQMSPQSLHAAQSPLEMLKASVVLLRDLIDYAGLFPPASLSTEQSVENYAAYQESKWNWILGRFIVPAGRLGEFEEALLGLPATAGTRTAPWRLSVLIGADAASDVSRIGEFNSRTTGSGRRVVIESVEAKAASSAEVAQLAALIPPQLETYFEIPISNAAECLAAIANCRRRAKIRTGGESPDKFPSPASVVDFIRLCAASEVPFKATAGLHHPLRSIHRLTYQSDSPSGMMHGFLNVFLAAAFLRAGMEPALAVQLLEQSSTAAVQFEGDGVRWRERRLSLDEIAAARKDFSISFGSCSFTEPIDDLQSLGLL